MDCGYSLEPPHRGGSNEYPQSMFWAEIWKISEFFLSENFQFLEVKFSMHLNGRVFVMKRSRDEEQIRTTQTPQETTDAQSRIATEPAYGWKTKLCSDHHSLVSKIVAIAR